MAFAGDFELGAQLADGRQRIDRDERRDNTGISGLLQICLEHDIV